MSDEYDFIVVGGGSAGAVIASRLSEDPNCRVALIEAGERPPEISALPIAPAAMQLNPATDWMFTADPGKAGLGLNNGRVPVPRGKMLGGSSGINYMMYVRGNPGDFDSWAEGGAAGWSYAEVLPYFKKSEGLAPSADIVIDEAAHNTTGAARRLGARPDPAGRTAIRRSGGRRRHPQRRLQWPRPRVSGRSRLADPVHDAKRAAVEHLCGLPRRRAGAAAQPDDHHRGASDAGAIGRRGRAHDRDRCRIPHRRWRHCGRPCHKGSDPQRRRDRLAASAVAVGHRAAAGTRNSRNCLSGRRA